jgi:hypothetical protein
MEKVLCIGLNLLFFFRLIFGEILPLIETLVWATPGIAEKTAQNFKMWQNFPSKTFFYKRNVTFPLK